jgi:hypothetical protein
MLHCVCAAWSPALGEACDGRWATVVTELFDGVANAAVRGRERVGIAQRAHRDVLRRPPADAGHSD